ncbi:synaptotagmin-15 [Chanos chanos]|uniref:Synaptotagmin-15 n=1 Tax=Chanos chanos TaxID=29144 RepID=A0A6J2VDV9_CHACN|nr:synaptotagmin-15-like [Chanos chanos]
MSMAGLLVPLVCGLCAGLLFLLLIGLWAYFLWRRKQNQMPYRELISTTVAIPSCTVPVLQTSQPSTYGYVLGEVPFFVPPRFQSKPYPSPGGRESEEEEDEEEYPDLHDHRGSLTAGSWFPLGSVRPDLYQVPEAPSEWCLPSGSAVRLWFAVAYQQEREQLLVCLLRAANLPRQCKTNTILVKLQLLPEDRRHRQAKARRKGSQPQFNDCFVFQVSKLCVDQCTLRMSMYSVDRQRKHQLIGRVLFPLRATELAEVASRVVWRDLESEDTQPCSKHGDLQISLNYRQSLQRLTVVVLRAHGLQCPSDAGVCVQVSLQIHTQVVKRKWTCVAKGSEPTFNEKLTFKLPPLLLDEACLILELQQPIAEEPVSLGLVVIGAFMYARGQELEHWNEMISKPEELVKQWHGLSPANISQSPT